MTTSDYELAERRAWIESHFHQHGLSDEEVMAFNPLPSENFSEGFSAGFRTGLYHLADRIDGLDRRLNRIICECRSEAFKHLKMVDLTLKKIRNGNQ